MKKKNNKKNNKKKFIPKTKNKQISKKKSILGVFENKILNFLKRDRETVFASRELMRKSGVKEKEQFYKSIKILEEYGHITIKSHKIKLNTEMNELEGELFSLSKGFGFVRPENGGEDIFIPGANLKSALVGDKVFVTNIRKDAKGYSGKISRIIKEGRTETTGTIAKTDWGYELIPDNKLRYNPILIDIGKAKIGDKVMARLIQDVRGDWTQADIIHSFGSGDSARVCADAIIAQHNIPTEFSQECLDEAKIISKSKISKAEIASRLDLRDYNIFTIDGADAKDLDDAIHVIKKENSWELGVHIADVSHYIKPKTAIDNEALERGTSVYFADRVIPMLPKDISNGVCSLTPDTDKLCFSAIITINQDGDINKYDFKKTIIRSRVKGVYSEINEIFSNTANQDILDKYACVKYEISLAYELAEILKKKSYSRGTMEIESDESRFVLDENGICVDIMPRESGLAQELIEQFMISANVCAAKFSKDKALPFLYRVHENPEPQRIRELHDFLKMLGIESKELLKEKPSTADFSAILRRVVDTKQKTIISDKLLRTMEKARYSVDSLGHFGLNLKDYSHFTSPIRRYPDTSIHRVMTEFLSGTNSETVTKKYKKFCENSATQSSSCEVRAVTAEREAEDCYMAEFMSAHIGEEFMGEVSGVVKTGVFVKLKNSVEGFLGTESFKDKNFVFDGLISHRCQTSGEVLTIGTDIKIIVAKSHVATGRIDFVPVG